MFGTGWRLPSGGWSPSSYAESWLVIVLDTASNNNLKIDQNNL